MPHHLLGEIHEEIMRMLEKRVIQPSRSPWQSPLVPLPKPDGSLCLCVDYPCLNNMTIFNAFPMPHMAELVKTAFGTPWGLYEFI